MVLRSLQPRIARHVVGVPFADFGSLVMVLYDVEDGISRGLWADSSPSDVKRKKPFGIERPPISYTAIGQPCYAATVHSEVRTFIPQASSSADLYTFCFEDAETVFTDRHAVEPGSSEAHRGRFVDCTRSETAPQPLPPHFRMDLHCAYHQGSGHETDRCTALRHAIQDLIDQGLVHLGQPSVTQNPLPAHTTHAVPPPDEASVHASIVKPPTFTRYSVQTPFILAPDVEEEEVRAEDDEILRQLQSTQARISIWSLLASSSTHRDALIRALSQIRVETTTTPEGLIHMMTVGRATCIVFSDDDLPPEGSDHTRPLYISVGCSGHRVSSILLDNGSALNMNPLATAIALGYSPSDFGPSTETVRANDSRPWIHRAGAIPSSLHQKVKFIHDGQVVVQSAGDIFITAEPVLEISHIDDDLFLTGFTFDEMQTLEIEDFCRDLVAMSFDQHSSTVVLDMMRGMSYLPGMGLGDVSMDRASSSPFLIMTYHLGSGSSPPRLTTDTWRACARRG
ncbi:hypothetical protein CK203_088881 [Vitis vinifera]|uniref:Uncharacterized protein n=1 Tax=Vitis vinifera TaxID=29760 RepID=A0A438D0N6_VITVI|nr:hypothetical protein CK203_088881 [Vitis vinifera]